MYRGLRRTLQVAWKGGFKEGSGVINARNVLKNVTYSLNSRWRDDPDQTSPEELLLAAHASCFTMMVSKILTSDHGVKPDTLTTSATLTTAANPPNGWGITDIHFELHAKVPNCTIEQLKDAARLSQLRCPISCALIPNVNVTMALNLEN